MRRAMVRLAVAAIACVATIGISSAALAEEKLVVLPAKFTLHGPAATQRLLAQIERDGRNVGQVTDGLTITSSNDKVAAIGEGGVVTPVGDGQATITVKHGDRLATAEVTVAAFAQPPEWTFRNHVQSVLAKSSCNSGACHGAVAGKNGFRLSLRGYDADYDYLAITRQARGRRVVLADPGRSLLLTKPTGTIAHKGGVRFDVGSPEYRAVSEWIAAGAPPPKESDPQVKQLEMLPGKVQLKRGAAQQLVVRAHFSDGRVEDVTRWAKFTATNETVATVDQQGRVNVVGEGEGAVTAWYLSQIAVATIAAPYTHAVAPEAFAKAPRRNFIDHAVLAKLESLNLPPSPQCTDAEFLRRAFIDTIGVLPTADEARAFLADAAPDKRDKLIEALLARPEFVDYWTYKWCDLLLVNTEKLKPPAMWAYYRWIRSQVAENTPWDKFVRNIVTATGGTLENGATNFFALHTDPPDLAETTSQAFLGMSIGCAKCHNHPLEKWTNDQYYGMANLFARVKSKDLPGEGNLEVFPVASGDLVQPRTGKPQPARPLDGAPLAEGAATDRRGYLADWLTSPDNPYFSRSITNRVWANFFGVGLVDAVDDLRGSNPASNEELLTAAARHLSDNKYDLKALMRTILQSAAYQRSSQSLPENSADRRFYSRYYPKRMMAEVLLDSLSQVTGVPTPFKSAAPLGVPTFDYPLGWRAVQLPDSNTQSYFLKSFGRPQRLLTCECERTAEPSMVQVLHLANGETVNEKLQAKGNRLEKLLADKPSDEKLLEVAFLLTVARYPTATEKEKAGKILAEAGVEKRQVLEDLFWSLLSSKEFLFNH